MSEPIKQWNKKKTFKQSDVYLMLLYLVNSSTSRKLKLKRNCRRNFKLHARPSWNGMSDEHIRYEDPLRFG